MLLVFVPMLGDFNNSLAEALGKPRADWTLGGARWMVAFLPVPVYFLWVTRFRRAVVVCTLLTIALLPASLWILSGALCLSITLLGEVAAAALGLGLLLGLGTLPLVVRERQRRHQSAMARGHLRRSLDTERGIWDP
jgi:hypothetical protein